MMIRRQSGLGRGLGALIPQKEQSATAHTVPKIEEDDKEEVGKVDVSVVEQEDGDVNGEERIRQIPVEEIRPNSYQPRLFFDHAGMEDLVSSIKEHGILQPLVVMPRGEDGKHELIAGERRLRAAKIGGLRTVPVIVRSATNQQKLELAIIENVQRKNLNAIEEAKAYERLQSEFNLTQDDIGSRVGKSRSQIANLIRLLDLEEEMQNAVASGRISVSNARTLLSIDDPEERQALFERMQKGEMTVRQAEARTTGSRRRRMIDPNVMELEGQLRTIFGLRVNLKRKPTGEGELRIGFQNDEDLKKILAKIQQED